MAQVLAGILVCRDSLAVSHASYRELIVFEADGFRPL